MKNIWLIALTSLALSITSCSKDDDDKIMYTVTFETDGGSPAPAVQRVEAGNTATAPSVNPAKADYVFMYWHLNGANAAYNFGSPVNSDIILYAKWQEEVKVEYWQVSWNLNSGVWPANDNHATEVVKGGTLAEPNAPEKTNNTFEGWYKEAEFIHKIDFPYDVSAITDNFTLYAKWTADGDIDEPSDYKMFTSVADMKAWLDKQYDSEGTPYKVGLKDMNLDAGNNWGDLGLAVNSNTYIYIDLNLQGCTGTAIPDGYKSGNTTYGVFVNCNNLKSIHLPDGLKRVGMYAFYLCNNLTSVTLPNSVKSIGELAFGWCVNLEGIDLPVNLQTIDKKAFASCDKLKYAPLPAGLTIISNEAFWGCISLESAHIPERIIAIGDDAYYGCRALASVTLPEGIEYIGNWFYNCIFTTITIPSTVTSINGGAFRTIPLDEIIMLSATPPALGINVFKPKDVFKPTSITVTIKVPAAGLDAYKAASGWKDYANRIVAY